MDEFVLDVAQACADLDELASLYVTRGLDLGERLRCLEDGGAVTFQINRSATVRAGDGTIYCRYKLADELLAGLAALRVRAGNIHVAETRGQVDHSVRS